jgi:Fe-S-cluster containining protein
VILRWRRDLIAGPHPDDDRRVLVFCERTGEHFELPDYGYRIGSSFDGSRTVEEVAARASELAGRDVDPEAVGPFVARLLELGLLDEDRSPSLRPPADAGPQWSVVQEIPSDVPIWVHPDAGYECRCAGTCCSAGYVVSLDEREVECLRAVAPSILGPGADPICVLPRGQGARWTYALANDPECPFLGKDRRCAIHGSDALPSTCRVYPLAFVSTGRRVHASVTHRCVCGALDRGPRLSAQMASLRSKLDASRFLPVIARSTRVDAYTRIGSPAAVDALTGATADWRDSAWETLLCAIRAVRDQIVEVDVGAEPLAPAAIFSAIAERVHGEELTVAHALARRSHPNRAAILDSLRRADLSRPNEPPHEEAARLARDYLSGLRIYRFSTLAAGFLALGLALACVTSAPEQPTAREQAMLWEDALLSPGLRALLGPEGPIAAITASVAGVERQIEALRAAFPDSGIGLP